MNYKDYFNNYNGHFFLMQMDKPLPLFIIISFKYKYETLINLNML